MQQHEPRDSSESVSLLLENQLCFGLYAASHAMTKAYRGRLKLLGLTYPQYLVMLALWEKDGRTVSELGQSLCLDSGTLSPLLKRLEASGLVLKTRLAGDERQVEISLTARADALRQPAIEMRKEMVKLINMSDQSIHSMRAELNQLITALALDHAEKPAERAA